MKLSYIFLLLVTLTNSCLFKSNKNAALPGTWRLYDIDALASGLSNGDDFSKSANLKMQVTSGTAMSFFDDGSYTEVKGDGSFKTGGWKLMSEKNVLYLNDSGRTGQPQKVTIETNASGKPVLTITNEQQQVIFKFIKESEPLKEFAKDPFYATNNQWRIKARASENTSQLTNRLANYFKHLALVLKASKERKQSVVSFEFSQGPIKIYNGGIGIYPYNIVPQYWKNYFYDDADASSAYYHYQDYLRNSSYKGAATGDWIDDDYNILLSIYAGITNDQTKKEP